MSAEQGPRLRGWEGHDYFQAADAMHWIHDMCSEAAV